MLVTGVLVLACGVSSQPVESPGATKSDVEAPVLSLASGTWAPFTDEAGKARIAVDLVHEALRRGGIQASTTIVHPQDLMGDLEAGKFAGSEALWKTDGRQTYLLYSDAYLENRLVLLGRAGQDVDVSSIDQLKGKKLGIVEGYAYGEEILGSKAPELVLGASDEDNLRTLLKGEVDYILVDSLLVYYLFEYSKDAAHKKLVYSKKPLATRSLYLALRKDHPGAAEIISTFNDQIATMTRDGTYHEVLKVSWLVTDIDGDGRDEIVYGGSHASQDPPDVQYHLSGATAEGAPRFMVEGEVYSDWQKVPARYKTTTDEPVDRFKPGINAVLGEF